MSKVKPKSKKRKSEQKHFDRRCIERLGIKFDIPNIIGKVRKNELKFLRRQSNRITIWEYEFEEKLYVVVYDSIRKMLVTIYPE